MPGSMSITSVLRQLLRSKGSPSVRREWRPSSRFAPAKERVVHRLQSLMSLEIWMNARAGKSFLEVSVADGMEVEIPLADMLEGSLPYVDDPEGLAAEFERLAAIVRAQLKPERIES